MCDRVRFNLNSSFIISMDWSSKKLNENKEALAVVVWNSDHSCSEETPAGGGGGFLGGGLGDFFLVLGDLLGEPSSGSFSSAPAAAAEFWVGVLEVPVEEEEEGCCCSVLFLSEDWSGTDLEDGVELEGGCMGAVGSASTTSHFSTTSSVSLLTKGSLILTLTSTLPQVALLRVCTGSINCTKQHSLKWFYTWFFVLIQNLKLQNHSQLGFQRLLWNFSLAWFFLHCYLCERNQLISECG